MTYCVGLRLNKGLVFMSDTRTNSGVDNISTFRKMFTWSKPGERVITMLTSGNLATTQSVVSLIDERTKAPAERNPSVLEAPTMFQVARQVGEMLRESRGGLTVPDHDADAIARAWARLLTPGLAHRMGTRAYSYALARYSWASSFERITRVYQQVSATEAEPEVYGPLAPIATSGAITGWSAKLTEWEPPAAEGRRRSVRRWRTPRRER